jgi:hypothetical protein
MRGTQPAMEVTLFAGAQSTKAVGIFDSGSVLTIFSPEHADLIGIDDVRTGTPERITTLGGSIDVYMFDLEIQLAGVGPRFSGQIGFFAGHSPRNILGRSLIFDAFEIGFHERGQHVNLRPE